MPSAEEITSTVVRDVARLSRLAMAPAELDAFAAQLRPILDYVAQLGQVNIEGVEPTAQAMAMSTALRDDVVGESLPVEAVLRNAAETDDRFFKVPKIIGGGEDSAG